MSADMLTFEAMAIAVVCVAVWLYVLRMRDRVRDAERDIELLYEHMNRIRRKLDADMLDEIVRIGRE